MVLTVGTVKLVAGHTVVAVGVVDTDTVLLLAAAAASFRVAVVVAVASYLAVVVAAVVVAVGHRLEPIWPQMIQPEPVAAAAAVLEVAS